MMSPTLPILGHNRETNCWHKSFAYLEMASCLSKMLFKYDMRLVNQDLDWEAASRCYVMWWKAPVMVCFEER